MRVGLLLVLMSACATTSTVAREPAFPPIPAMPSVAVPAFYNQGGSLERMPGTAGVALVSTRALSSSRTLSKRASRLFAQADSASDVQFRKEASTTNDQESEAEPAKERALRKPGLVHEPGVSDGQGVPDKTAMIDIEATLQLIVQDVRASAATLRELAHKQQGMITEDVVDQGRATHARFTIRVPSAKVDDFLAGCEALGQTRSRQVQARDIGKEFHDAQLLLGNLTVAMHRYEEILKGATQVSDVLAVERELDRLRAQIDQVKGTLVWMQDRVSRSTVHVYLASPLSEEPEDVVVGRAKLYPGVRLGYLADFRSDGARAGYLGAGLSFRFHRAFGIDLEGFRHDGDATTARGLDAFLATMGGEAFSEFMGNGRRRFVNPYLGWRLGYARFERRNEFAFACAFGVELIKTRPLTVDLAARLYGLLGKSSHMAVAPALSVNVAF